MNTPEQIRRIAAEKLEEDDTDLLALLAIHETTESLPGVELTDEEIAEYTGVPLLEIPPIT